MSRIPIPDDWIELDHGWTMYTICCPNSVQWRALVRGSIYNLTRGRKWDERTGVITEAQAVAERIYDSMQNCGDWLKTQRMLVAAIVGEAVDLTDPAQLVPDNVDFSQNGLVPTIRDLLEVDRVAYADMNIAEVLFEALVGRKFDPLPLPFQGVGIADIADEQLDTLHNRFRMTDSSLFNPLGEKNIVEALETQLRLDKPLDLELLTPNVVTMMSEVFKLENDSPLKVLFNQLYEWATGTPLSPIPEDNTVAELLLLIAQAKQKASTEPLPIDLNVTCGKCGSSGGCGCGGGSEPPSDPGTEGDPPPPGWETPTDPGTGDEILPGSPEYQSRKCKVANLIHQQTKDLLDKIIQSELLSTAAEVYGDSYLQMTSTAIGYIIGEMATPIPFVDGLFGAFLGTVIGWLADFVLKLFIGEVDLPSLRQALTDNEQDLVCELHNATNAWEGTNNYLQVLADNGVNIANREIILALFIPRLINLLFFKNSEVQQIEAGLDGYVGPVDCSACGCSPIIRFGTDGDDPYGVMNSELFPTSGKYYISVIYNCALTSFRVASISGYSPAQNISGNDWIISPDGELSSDRPENIYESMTPPPGTYNGVWAFSFRSETPFSITLEVTQ